MNLQSCAPGAWVGFVDPAVSAEEENKDLAEFKKCVEEFKQVSEESNVFLPLKPIEESTFSLMRLLRDESYNVENAMKSWEAWVKWRRATMVDDITTEDIKHEISDGLASWRGRDKEGRPACVITGRNMDPMNRLGSVSTFQKFLLYTAEEGYRISDEMKSDEVCVIYDRRGLEFKNIDSHLYRMSNITLDAMRRWYRGSLGKIYIVHLNLFFWMVFAFIIKPLLGLLSSDGKIIVVEDPIELLEYFDEDQLFLLSYTNNESGGGGSSGGENAAVINAVPKPKVIMPEALRSEPVVQSGIKR